MYKDTLVFNQVNTAYHGVFNCPTGKWMNHFSAAVNEIITKRILFNTTGTAYMYLGANGPAVVAAAGLATSGTTTRSLSVVLAGIKPGTITLVDSQGVTWTDNNDGTMSPTGTGATEDGVSGDIDYITGQVYLTYTGDPGAITLTHAGYTSTTYLTWISEAGTPNSVIISDQVPAYPGETIIFVSSTSVAKAEIMYEANFR